MMRPPFRFAAFALVLATPLAAQRAASDPFDGIPDVTFTYYEVGGSTPQEIRTAINAKRPTDTTTGRPFDAISRWHFNWRWRTFADGSCDLAHAELTFRAEVIMPRLANPDTLDPALRTRWERYWNGLREHESGHVRYPYEQRGRILDAIHGATCDTANQAARTVIREFNQRDLDYDAGTDHGATQGARFP